MANEKAAAAVALGDKVIALINDEGFTTNDSVVVINAMIFALAQLCLEADADGEEVAKTLCSSLRKLRAAAGRFVN